MGRISGTQIYLSVPDRLWLLKNEMWIKGLKRRKRQ
jgi:hypothetical protein